MWYDWAERSSHILMPIKSGTVNGWRQFVWGGVSNRASLLMGLALALALLAAHPFLSRPGLPRDTDAELHVFRAAELGYALRGGAGYVRWAPDLWYGYGYPIFNYYAPLTYYVANVFAILPGLDIVGGTKAVFVLGLILGALGAFMLGRDVFGQRAGLVAAAAYTFSPYILLIDPHIRGDLPELFALALFPWLLKFVLAACHLPPSIYLPLAAFTWAALIVTHNLMALILSVICVAWLLWLYAIHRTPRVWRIAQLILLAAGLSAFFWLPFVAEREAVHLTVTGAGHFDFHNHFVAWRTLFALSRPLDLGAATPHFQHNLGLAQWLLALCAVPLAFFYRRKPQGRVLFFFILGSAFLVFLMLSPSAFIWEHVPLMSYIQFPWRLLGPAALTLAMCSGGVIWSLEEAIHPAGAGRGVQKPAFLLLPAACLLLILALALPAMYPPGWSPDFGLTTPQGMLQVELDGRYLGTTSTGDFVPSTVQAHPPANKQLVASYQQGRVDKFDKSTLPPGASADVAEHGPTRDRFVVSSPQPFTARVLTFYFPGWRVQIDGQTAASRPGDPYGLIEFDVPAGQHDVIVTFGSTLPRILGTIISLLALVALGFQANLQSPISTTQSPILNPHYQTPNSVLHFEVAVIAAFALFKFAVADPCDTCFRYTSPPGQALSAQHSLASPMDFGHHILLLGYDLPVNQVRSGDKLALTLYWKALAPVPKNYQVFAHLIRPAPALWGQSDKLNPGDAPTTRWPLDKFVWDDHALRVLPGTPPGEYQLSVGLYTLDDGARAPLFDAAGQIVGDSFTLPVTIRVLPASVRVDHLAMDKKHNIAYNGATLLGHAVESAGVRAPGFVRVTLFWQANADAPAQPALVRVALVDARGSIVAHVETEPTGGIFPLAQWRRGQVVRDIYSLWLGDQVTPGMCTARLTVDGGVPLDLATVQVFR